MVSISWPSWSPQKVVTSLVAGFSVKCQAKYCSAYQSQFLIGKPLIHISPYLSEAGSLSVVPHDRAELSLASLGAGPNKWMSF